MIDYKKMAEANNLGWNVNKVELYTSDGSPTGVYGIQREDTGSIFCTVSKVYKPFQNYELFELADSVASEVNMPVHKAGAIKGGRLVYVQLLAGSSSGIGDNNDTVKNYVTCLTSHDGTTPIKWGSSHLTISCMNTFHRAARGLKDSARHTSSGIDKIRKAIMEVENLRDQIKHSNNLFERLSKKKVSKKQVEEMIEIISGINPSMPIDQKRETYHGRMINRSNQVEESVTREMSYKGSTLWGLWSGVTHYTTHKMGRTEDNRMANKMNGLGQTIDSKALNLVSSWL